MANINVRYVAMSTREIRLLTLARYVPLLLPNLRNQGGGRR